MGTGQFDKLITTTSDILDLIEKAERQYDSFDMPGNPYAWFSAMRSAGLGWMGSFEEGKIFLEKGLRHATRIGDLRMLALVEFFFGFVFHLMGDWKAAARHAQKSIKYNEEAKFMITLCIGWAILGNAYTHLGDPETGKTYGVKGLKMQRDAGIDWFLSLQYLYLSETQLQLGDLENARGSAEEALRLSQKNNEKYYEATAWIMMGRILGETENPQIHKAEECMLKGMNMWDELKAKPTLGQGHLFLGGLYANAAQKEKALENLKKAETMFQEMGMEYWVDRTRTLLEVSWKA
jgi:tetratricopeptide (TPR) repeat protein